jgi:UDP-galactopyranose mutase
MTSHRYDVLVCGAGFTGAVLAERLANELGKRVLLIDRRTHIGGNAYDCFDNAGVLIHKYGPHIFHTNSDRIVQYLSRFTTWRPYEHRVRGFVDGQFIPLPVNLTALELLLGQVEATRVIKLLTDEFGLDVKVPILKMRESASPDVRRIADLIYEKVFLHYTLKQWALRPDELDAAVSARVPVHLSRDDRYFQDSFQKMPAEGYTPLFERMLSNPLIETRLGTSFKAAIEAEQVDRVVFTGPIDEFFDHIHGKLPYRSIRFDFMTDQTRALLQSVGTENYPTPASQHPYTRSTEFRFLTGQDGIDATTRAFEYAEAYVPGVNEPYYPIPREENRQQYRRYEEEARRLKSVVFAGRLADYQYYNMDQAIGRALTCFERELVPMFSA